MPNLSFHLECKLQPRGPRAVANLLLPAWTHPSSQAGSNVPKQDHEAMMLSYDFSTAILTATVGRQITKDVAPRVGGGVEAGWAQEHARLIRRTKLHARPGEVLQLQMFVDFSVVELFLGDGQVLSTRVYRGEWGLPEDSVGGGAGDQELEAASTMKGDSAVTKACFGVNLWAGQEAGEDWTTAGVLAEVGMHVMNTCWDAAGQAEEAN